MKKLKRLKKQKTKKISKNRRIIHHKKPYKKALKKKVIQHKKKFQRKLVKRNTKSHPKNNDKSIIDDKIVKVRKPSIEKMYFTTDTEDAIVSFNSEECQYKRDTIYNEKIKYPFEKLVENIFNTFKFTYFDVGPEDVQKETLSHLVSNIHKYKKEKGKAYSYFSIIAKNYLIFHNNLNFKHFKTHTEIADEHEEGAMILQTEDSFHERTENKEFINLMIRYWDNNVNRIFKKQKDVNIAQAVIELFRNNDKIDSFNKKALYLYIREISACHTQQITKVINKMKQYQNIIAKNYANSGRID